MILRRSRARRKGRTEPDDQAGDEHPDALDIQHIPLASLDASGNNPRRRLTDMDELTDSIRTHGLLQPVVVRRRGRDGYELIAGHRRLEAVKTLGWTEIERMMLMNRGMAFALATLARGAAI